MVKVTNRKSVYFGEVLPVLRSYETHFGPRLLIVGTSVGEAAFYSDEVEEVS